MACKGINVIMLPKEATIVNEILTHIKNKILIEHSALLEYLEYIHTTQNNDDNKNTYLLRMLEGCNLINVMLQSKIRNYTLSIEGYIAQSKGIIKYEQEFPMLKEWKLQLIYGRQKAVFTLLLAEY